MRVYKTSKFLFVLLLFCISNLKLYTFNLDIRKYQNSKNSKILYAYIFIDKQEQDLCQKSETNSQEKNTKNIVNLKKLILEKKINKFFRENNNRQILISEIINLIEDENALIISTSLFENLIIQTQENSESQENSEYIENLYKLFFENNYWNIFATRDKNFVALIPHSKYDKVGKRANLTKIGLNPKNLFSIKRFNKKFLKNNLKILLNKKNKHISNNLDSLFNIFLHKRLKNRTLLWQ